MPEKQTLERAQEDEREGKSASTQAGEFVKEEMDHVREGKHGARSAKQVIAIGLSKARRAGVKLPPPKRGATPEATRVKAEHDLSQASRPAKKTSAKRSQAVERALKREGHSAASRQSLSKQAHQSAQKRGSAARKQAAKKAVRTKGPAELSRAARKAARSRQRRAA